MKITAFERFMRFVKKRKNGCWEWQGYVGKKGYGTFFNGKEMEQAHRWSYKHHVGEIPSGLVMDHLCRNRCCVNPEHLEPVTNQENCVRGETGKNTNHVRKEFCRRGHRLTEDNVKITKTSRICKVCHEIRWKIWYEKNGDKVRERTRRRHLLMRKPKSKQQKEI